MSNKLEQLRRMTVVVADSGDMEAIRAFAPQDCTTNPSLILKAVQTPAYAGLVADTLAQVPAGDVDLAVDRLAVAFGAELSRIVPGYVSTEVDARLSFDTAATVARAKRIIGFYRDLGVDPGRILIKVAATWEGIQAARALEADGIRTNVTLIFSLAQAVAAAEAGAFLISPFVGRILDWHVKASGRTFTPEEDPGVLSVRQIYNYFKYFGHETVVMGASFRSVGEVEALAGCDRLTISPALLKDLQAASGVLPRHLDAGNAQAVERLVVDEAAFRWHLNQDAMATEKLAEGIRAFHKDTEELRRVIVAHGR